MVRWYYICIILDLKNKTTKQSDFLELLFLSFLFFFLVEVLLCLTRTYMLIIENFKENENCP